MVALNVAEASELYAPLADGHRLAVVPYQALLELLQLSNASQHVLWQELYPSTAARLAAPPPADDANGWEFMETRTAML